MNTPHNLTKTFLFIFLLFTWNCKTLGKIPAKVLPDNPLSKENEKILRICFWNVKNLSLNGLKRTGKGNHILEFSKTCDIIVYLEIRSARIDMASEFTEALRKEGKDFLCEEGISKGADEGTRTEKYLACAQKEISEKIEKEEYPDEDNDFARPPTLFFINMIGKKLLVVPFHSTPGDKEELKSFQKVVDLSYKNYSDRRIFFGGDFNTGSNYQKMEFLASIPYFSYLKQLIDEPTTFADQKHDLIFTDKLSAVDCKGKVWRLDALFPAIESRKELEKISDHFPISAECKFKNY